MAFFSRSEQMGLCQGCEFVRTIKSAKGSQFTFCRLSETQPEFPKYPVLPVLHCKGYKPKACKDIEA